MEKSSKSAKTSIFTPEKTVKFFFVSLVGNIVVALIVWPLFDLLWDSVISRSTFSYNVMDHVVWPAIVMLICTIVEFVFFDSLYKKKEK